MTVITIIGGGFTGTLLALKLAAAEEPDLTVQLVERNPVIGKGVAYGACRPFHFLNVPAHRMELGLAPGFQDWLRPRYDGASELADAFVSRMHFGDYMSERLKAAQGERLRVIRGEACGISEDAKPKVILRDGRRLESDILIIASGNFAPKPTSSANAWIHDSPYYVADPWARGALDGISPSKDVLLIGTGLTSIDVTLSLATDGHRGRIVALSRRGLIPLSHQLGGTWPTIFEGPLPKRLSSFVKIVRREAAKAAEAGVPWQRIPDALRPQVAAIWDHLDLGERARFIRHLRPWWDIHRHRMPQGVAGRIDALKALGNFENVAGRIVSYRAEGDLVNVTWRERGKTELREHPFQRVINCTGPDADVTQTGDPLLRDLLRRDFIRRDALGLGIETREGAAVDRDGRTSRWLYALGPLTKAAWWEIVAVPEIRIQVERMVEHLLNKEKAAEDLLSHRPIPDVFADLGAGI